MARPHSRSRRRPVTRRRLSLSTLESRVTPATQWVGGSGDWNDPAHWDNGLPVAGEDALIPVDGVTVTISADAQAASIQMTGAAGTSVLAMSAGTLTLTEPSDITNLQMTGGTFTSGLESTILGTASIGTATLRGQFRNDATLTLSGSPTLTDVTLRNTGLIRDGATLSLSGNVTINNERDFDVTFNGTAGFLTDLGGGTVRFHNALGGTLTRSGTGTASFDGVPFQNDAGASIAVAAGILLVNTTGTLAAGPITVSPGGTLRFDNSTGLALSGSFAPTGTGHVDVTGGTLDLGGGTVGFNFPTGMLTVSGTATVQNGTLNNTGALRVADGSTPALVNLTLNNSGTITDGGRLDFGGDATLKNLAGGTFDASFAGGYTFANTAAGTGNAFHNAGTLKRSATGTAQLGGGLPFQGDSGATLDITAGTLLLNTSGSLAAGPISVTSGAALRFDGTTNLTLAGSFAPTGTGHVDITGGALGLGGGTVGFNFPAGMLTVSGAPVFGNGILNNTGALRVADGSTPALVNLTLNNAGTIADGGRLDFGGSATVNNLAGGTFDASFAGGYTFANTAAGTGNLFHNAGTLRRTGTGTAQFGGGLPFQGDAGAAIDITAGTLLVNTTGTLAAGPITVAGGAALQFDASTNLTLSGTFVPTGAGQVNVTGGTLDLGGGTVGFNFPVGMLTVSGSPALRNGTLNNTGAIRFAGGSTPRLADLTLTNTGTIAGDGRLDFAGNAVVNNQAGATFDAGFVGDYQFLNNLGGTGNAFHNAGTLTRSATGTARLDGFPMDNTGTVLVLAGTLNLNGTVAQVSGTTLTGGTWDVHAGAALLMPGVTLTDNAAAVTLRGTASAPVFDTLTGNGGSLALVAGHSLALTGDFTNTGTVTLGPASTLTAAGTFTQTAAGTTTFQLGGPPAGGQFGRVASGGATTLAGTAGFAIVGGYTPANGDAFTLMTFPSHAGTFSGYTGLVPAQGVFLTPVTNPADFGINILVDLVAPTSAVTAFPHATTNRPAFHVTWGGSDNAGGAGLAGYDVYVSDDGGPFAPWLTGVTTTTAVFTGQVNHTYAFYTRATDLVGNTEDAPPAADATLGVFRTVVAVGKAHTFTDADGDTYTVRLTGPGNLGAVLLDPTGPDHGALDYLLADGTTTKSSISVTVKKNKATGNGVVAIGDVVGAGSLGSFSAPAADLVMGGFDFSGPVKSVRVHDVRTNDPALATPAIRVGGAATDKVSITAGRVLDGTSISTPGLVTRLTAAAIDTATVTAAGLGQLRTGTGGGLNIDLQVAGAVGSIRSGLGASGTWTAASFGPITAANGGLSARVTSPGAIRTVTVRGGSLSDTLTADRFGAVSVTGGDFNGTLTSTTPAATLGKARALASLKVTGGNLSGHVRVLGKAGPITVAANKTGGGTVQGATITASDLASLTVGKNFADSIVLAGADLGADFAFGGGDDAFAAGTIGTVRVGGNVTGAVSLIGAGFSRTGGGDAIVGGTASSIGSLTVAGTADANLHFAAGRFKAKPRIGGQAIDPLTDPRFLV